MFSRKLLRGALLGATAAVVCSAASPAAAQRIDEIYAFGDSYADEGNAFELGLVDPALFPLYPTGRFTGGANYIDILADLEDATIYNFAIGGARANPHFLLEVNAFATGGGGVFPTVTPAFEEDDLITVSIGGNDARAYGSTPGASVAGAPAAALPAIAATAAGLDVLVDAGAPTISFLAGNTGELPEVANNPTVAAIRSAYSNAFNLGVQQVLAGYAADGVIVHYLDLSMVLDQVEANPGAYGISAITCPAFPNPTCVINAGGTFLIYGDLLHPTSAGSAIIAQYISTQLQAPLTLAGTSEAALDSALQFGRTLGSRLDLGGDEQGLQFFAVGDALSRNVKSDDATDAFDVDSVGATAGVSYGMGNATVGAALNYSRPRAEFGADAAQTRGNSYRLGAFAGFDFGGGFAQAYVGVGRDNHRIRRRGVVEGMAARPDGNHVIAGASVGYLMPFGGVEMGPVAALDYGRAKVDGYTEEGDPALTLEVSSVTAKSLTGSFGVQLRGQGEPGAMGLQPFASATLEKEMSGGGDTVRFSQTSAPVIVNSWELDDASTAVYGRIAAGATAKLMEGIDLDALASTTVGNDDGNEVSVHVGLRLGF
jgi:uncharacterized protein YhjY with autotransporter beta-barrel domain/phospholipase/lecithinase/hemolysin